jgi:hypothetical protein
MSKVEELQNHQRELMIKIVSILDDIEQGKLKIKV